MDKYKVTTSINYRTLDFIVTSIEVNEVFIDARFLTIEQITKSIEGLRSSIMFLEHVKGITNKKSAVSEDIDIIAFEDQICNNSTSSTGKVIQSDNVLYVYTIKRDGLFSGGCAVVVAHNEIEAHGLLAINISPSLLEEYPFGNWVKTNIEVIHDDPTFIIEGSYSG